MLYEEVLAHFVLPDDARCERVVVNGVPCIWVTAPGADYQRATIYVHGGGWSMGSASGYQELAYRFSVETGSRVLVVDYRLAPENPYPAPNDDVLAVYRWLRNQPEFERIAIAGDSAGGGITTGVTLALRDAGDTAPDALVLLSPLVDLTGEAASLTERANVDPLPAAALVQQMGGAYLQGRDPRETPYGSPLHANLEKMPPTLIFVGTDEGLFDDSVRLADRIKNAGGSVTLEIGEGMIHIYPLFNFLPEAKTALEIAGRFLRERFET